MDAILWLTGFFLPNWRCWVNSGKWRSRCCAFDFIPAELFTRILHARLCGTCLILYVGRDVHSSAWKLALISNSSAPRLRPRLISRTNSHAPSQHCLFLTGYGSKTSAASKKGNFCEYLLEALREDLSTVQKLPRGSDGT